LVDGAPKIKPVGTAPIKALCSQAQDSATTAAHIENLFVAPKMETIQQFSPDEQFSPASRTDVADKGCQWKQTKETPDERWQPPTQEDMYEAEGPKNEHYSTQYEGARRIIEAIVAERRLKWSRRVSGCTDH
jgi:hypothetical protein